MITQTIEALTSSIGLIALISTIVVDLFLAFIVFRSNSKSATNIIFTVLSFSIIFWLSTISVVYSQKLSSFALLAVRLGIFFAAPVSASFFLLAHTFPSDKLKLSKKIFWVFIFATIAMMAWNLSPYAFTGAEVIAGEIHTTTGPGIIPFSIFSTIFSFLAVYLLIKKYKNTKDTERQQIGLVLTGIFLMLLLVILTVLIPIIIIKSGAFIPVMPLYTLIFLGMTAYAIVKHHLFNIKIIATEALTVLIWILLFSKALTAESFASRITDVLILLLTIIFGISLIKTVRKEVEQRERLENLTIDLEAANKKLQDLDALKSEFLSFASHQVKSPMVVVKGYAQLIADGTYGQVPAKVKETSDNIKKQADKLIALVNNLLDITKIEEGGKIDLKFSPLDIVKLIADMVEQYKILATEKKLDLSFESAGPSLTINGDEQKITQIIQNLLDNSLKYTPAGFIKVKVEDKGASVLISVVDSGRGMSKELLAKLFGRYIRDEKTKNEVQGTGLGLYLAKQIAIAHNGEIWAESDGEGKGSHFYVRLSKAGTQTSTLKTIVEASQLEIKK